jgi:5-methylcytosine-specific restriction enzyme A
MTDSRIFPRAVKREACRRANGCCEACGIKIGHGGIEYHHIIEWTISHDSSLGNCKMLCVPCHRDITMARRPAIDKTRRLRDRAIGIKRASKKMPAGRDSAIKKKISGEVVPRQSGTEKHRELMEKLYGDFQ